VSARAPGDATAPAQSLEARLEREAYALGFDLVGFVRLGPAETAGHFDDWLALGRAGTMDYMGRDPELRHDTRRPHPGAVSAIVVGLDYGGAEPSGPVARYARGDDYHVVMRDRLRQLHAGLEAAVGHEVPARPYVDTAPILERDLARRAGLGWFGKNTNLINPGRGSYFFIGSLFVAHELQPSAPFAADRCGSCTRCIEACPTDALVAPRELDARRCISYLTIEQRGAIDEELREAVGGLLYGCDICQEVCPWNVKFARALPDESPFRSREALDGKDARVLARALLTMSAEESARAFRGSAMKRAKLRGLQRNAAVVLGNVGTAEDVGVLARVRDAVPDELVREHVAWALGRVGRAGRGPSSLAPPDDDALSIRERS
jgi:epoxyqueuosine reductase